MRNVVIDNTEKNRDNYYKKHKLWGTRTIVLTENQINSILEGKCIACNDGEYATFITLKGNELKEG